MTRQSYIHERTASLTTPVALALIEGGVVGVLARKAFDAPPWMFAAIMAAPMFANMTSFFWTWLARGRKKIPMITSLQVVMLLLMAAIAMLPTSPVGAVMLTALVIAARCCVVGAVTLRSIVWRMNYPRHMRAQITGRFALISSIVITTTPLVGYLLLDLNAELFRVLYPAGALVAVIGVLAFSRVRLRGERDLLSYERNEPGMAQATRDRSQSFEYDPDRPSGRPTFFTVLRDDRFFRSYMIWQFVAGLGNMMGEVALVYLVAELTANHDFEYLISIALSTAIPMGLATVTLPIWARKLDQMHIAEFRSRQALFWIGCQSFHWIGAATGLLSVLLIGRVLQGISRGGGMLAWQLGHNDFASRQLVPTYMGIHVTLTGVRGAIGPFFIMALYAGWRPQDLPWIGPRIPPFDGIGYHVFLLTLLFTIIAEFGFSSLHRAVVRDQSDRKSEA